MSFQIDVICLILSLLVAVNVIGIIGYVAMNRLGARREKRDAAVAVKAMVDYFRKSGVTVTVDCIRVPGTRGFVAAIESEPMKRFRLSHIIESTLREHVRKTCALEVARVYWRFPIQEAVKEAVKAEQPASHADEYINEGLDHYRHIPKPEVTELPWEQFENMTTISRENTAAAAPAVAR
jgi:aspartate-semialdehyde dehydrogenase